MGNKQPYYFRLSDHRLFTMAGLWEQWTDPGSEKELHTCALLTTDANELTQDVHDRMPCILREEDLEQWMEVDLTQADELLPVLRPFEDGVELCPVSKLVNAVRNDTPDCIAPRSEV